MGLRVMEFSAAELMYFYTGTNNIVSPLHIGCWSSELE